MATKVIISGIYMITNMINGKHYVGSSIDIRERFYEHNRLLMKGNHENDYLQKAWMKYGSENFMFEVIESCPMNQLLIREQYYMDLYQVVELGYNINPLAGATRRGAKLTEKQRIENSERQRGHKVTEETRRKMSLSQKGLKKKKFSEEARRNMSFGQMGKRCNFSEEHKRRISLSKFGAKYKIRKIKNAA